MKCRILLILGLVCTQFSSFAQANSPTFAIGDSSFLLNGKPYVIRCGEMHFARIPKEYWRHRLQMAKAMGLNTVCAYLFWNLHEQQPGQYNWQGQADAAAFCRIAQEEGLYVILRPGPYSCAEWEFGGLPWWLLKDKTMKVRTQHPYYLESSRKYLKEVGKQLAPLQVSNGGPILMVQVENEYGSYGTDKVYMNTIKSFLQEAGFTVPLFHCDGPPQLKNDHPEGLFAVVNFGSNPEASFKPLRDIQPTGPLMCGEYYPGWFDSWGRPHHTGSSDKVVKELQWMLNHKASFSIYMVHGGTTFGTYSGANAPPYLPQTSSYDYDAPIDEAGNATNKFYAIRELFSKYLQENETLPNVPAPIPSQTINHINFTAVAPLWDNLPQPVPADSAILMEDLDQAYGAVLYTTSIPAGPESTLQFGEIHDYALVYINKELIGAVDRRKGKYSIELPARTKPGLLEVLVEATGRVNYGSYMHDRKGIHGDVVLINGNTKTILKHWKNYPLPMGDKNIPLKYKPPDRKQATSAAFYKGNFTVEKPGDTYLDVRKWNKGLVWVNGICLGRFWNIGPTQTMMLPGCWLKKGINEVVVFDLYGVNKPELQGLDKPILNELKEPQPQAHKKPGQQWKLSEADANDTGSFNNTEKWQVENIKPAIGRYVCLEALNSFDSQPFTTLAELFLLDEKGNEIPRSKWRVLYADSEETGGEDGNAENIFDLQYSSFWHTQWQDASPKHPHQVVIDLGTAYKISGIKILQRQDSKNGRIKDYRLYISEKKFTGL
jgi:beta-galactosidase